MLNRLISFLSGSASQVEYGPCVVPAMCWELIREFVHGFIGPIALNQVPQSLQVRKRYNSSLSLSFFFLWKLTRTLSRDSNQTECLKAHVFFYARVPRLYFSCARRVNINFLLRRRKKCYIPPPRARVYMLYIYINDDLHKFTRARAIFIFSLLFLFSCAELEYSALRST